MIASNKSSFVFEAIIISVNLGWVEGFADFLAAGLMAGLGAAALNIVGDFLRLPEAELWLVMNSSSNEKPPSFNHENSRNFHFKICYCLVNDIKKT